ncbi:MAG: pyridoxine 5'-phosphate synthase [Bacteroidales bacterium]|jgi:pyridoxine 5-phosphate synthase|nr:pyridoxine 5'-phosphate synthase [Bacteroidales bacterium]
MNTRLSVNINKVATIRNARGGNMPDLIQVAKDCERFGAQGITVHPRPDGRHIKYQDVYDLKKIVTTEFNIEGYPSDSFMELVTTVVPTQVTLVPDPPEALTSNAGWDTLANREFLTNIINRLHDKGIRTSIFVNADPKMVAGAKDTGTDRVELYTESYAANYLKDREAAIRDFVIAAQEAERQHIGLNAGHDLSLVNLKYFQEQIPGLLEVSIGHALICDALYLGLQETIRQYLQQLQ